MIESLLWSSKNAAILRPKASCRSNENRAKQALCIPSLGSAGVDCARAIKEQTLCRAGPESPGFQQRPRRMPPKETTRLTDRGSPFENLQNQAPAVKTKPEEIGERLKIRFRKEQVKAEPISSKSGTEQILAE